MLRRLRGYTARAATRLGSEPLRHTLWARRARLVLYVFATLMLAWEISLVQGQDTFLTSAMRILTVATLYVVARWPSAGALLSLPLLLAEYTLGFHPTSLVFLVPMTISGILVASRPRAIAYMYVLAVAFVLTVAQPTEYPLADLASWILIFLIPCVIGEATRYMLTSIDRIRHTSTEHLRRQRRDLARELHDTSIHDITAMIMALERAKIAGISDPRAADESDHAIATGRQSVVSMRGGLKFLRHHDAPGGTAAIPDAVTTSLPTVRQVLDEAELVLARAGLTLQAHVEDQMDPPLAFSVRAVIVRVVQEGTANMAKYGKPGTTCTVMVERTDTDARALLVNDVADRAVADSATSSGLGLLGVQERVEAVGGTVVMRHHDGRWMLQVSIPTLGTTSEGQVERAGQR